MKIKIAAAVLAFAASLCGQDTAQVSDVQAKITKILRVHGNTDALGTLARTPGGASIMVNESLHAIVANGSPAAVAEVERIVHELDTDAEKKDVELTFYLLSGSSESPSAGAEPENPALAPVYRQLRAIFPVKTYRLVNTMLMRSRDTSDFPGISGMLRSLNGASSPDANQPGTYRIQCSASADPSSTIHVTHLYFEVQLATAATLTNSVGSTTTPPQRTILSVGTKLDLREGQKVVVGTSNIEPGGITLFLVLSARIVP